MSGIATANLNSSAVLGVTRKTHRSAEWRIATGTRDAFLGGIILVLLCDIPEFWGAPFHVARIAAILLMGLSLVLPPTRGLPLLLALCLAGRDILTIGEFDDDCLMASVWSSMSFGPVNPSMAVFACAAIQLIRLRIVTFDATSRLAMWWFATVPIITGIMYGGFSSGFAATEVVVDVKFGIMLLLPLIMVRSFCQQHPDTMPRLLATLFGVLLARHAVDFVYFLTGYGPVFGLGNRVSVDSAKGAVILLALFGLSLAIEHKRARWGVPLMLASVLLVAVYGTRLLYVTLTLSLLFSFYSLGMKRTIWAVCLALLITPAAVSAVSAVNPGTATQVIARFKTITEGREEGTFDVAVNRNALSAIDPIRYGELLNTFNTTGERWSFLWGSGYGSYYHDDAVKFPPELKSAFPDYSLTTGKFFSSHNYLIHMLFKHGLIGTVIISSVWWSTVLTCSSQLRKARAAGIRDVPPTYSAFFRALTMFVGFTGMLAMFWSGKGLLINGVILALCASQGQYFDRLRRSKERESSDSITQ